MMLELQVMLLATVAAAIPPAESRDLVAARRHEPAKKELRATELASFALTDPGDQLILPVTLDGKEYPFLLDTGWARTIFDVDLESHLGKATRERSLPGGVVEQIKTYQRGPELRLGRVRLPKEHGVECGDLTAMRHICARDFYGVLGVDYLRGLILRIDFERKRASVLAELPGTKAELGERLALSPDWTGLHYAIEARVGDKKRLRLTVDTGCLGVDGALPESTILSLAHSGDFRETGRERHATIAGERMVTVGTLKTISVGPYCDRDLKFSTGPLEVLGLNYISRFGVVHLDLRENALCLKRASAKAGAQAHDCPPPRPPQGACAASGGARPACQVEARAGR